MVYEISVILLARIPMNLRRHDNGAVGETGTDRAVTDNDNPEPGVFPGNHKRLEEEYRGAAQVGH